MKKTFLSLVALCVLVWTTIGCDKAREATRLEPPTPTAPVLPTMSVPDRATVPLQFISEWSNAKKPVSTMVGGDLNITFPFQYYVSDPTVEMIVQGDFPRVRYFAFTAYDERNRPIATLRDQDIVPDPGSANPFVANGDWNAKDRRYTLTIRFSRPSTSIPTAAISHTAPNTIYVGESPDGRPNARGRLVYLRCLPSEGLDEDGGVDEPVVYYRKLGDGSFAKPPQAKPTETPESATRRYTPVAELGSYTLNGLQWRRPAEAAPWAESTEIAYLTAPITPDQTHLLVIRWKAPTFPDTYRNKAIRGSEQLRYWSVSFVNGRQLTTALTLSDSQAAIGPDGYVTLVVSFGAPRPAKATAEFGYTWVDLKNRPVTALIYRNLLPAPWFERSVEAVSPGALAEGQLGEYLPVARYITPDEF